MKFFTSSIVLLLLFYSSTSFSQDFPDEFCNCEKQTIKSETLNQERILFVYLPNNYAKDTIKTYPVYYITDAPATSNLYFDLMRLHAIMNYVPECIMVGLSSDGREHNMYPGKGVRNYQEFIEHEVFPFIDKSYRTNSFKLLAGHSLGADFVIYSMLKNPTLFSAYISGSPGPIEPIIELIDETDFTVEEIKHTFFYSSVGSRDFTDTVTFKKFETTLKKKAGNQPGFHFKINEDENHISNMAINFQNGIRQLYHDWQFQLPNKLEKPVSAILIDHYDHLENKLGYRPQIGEWEVIYPIMDKLARRGDFTNAIDILKYCIELYPESDQAYVFLAKAHFDTGKMDLGNQYLKKSLELNPDNQFALQMKKNLEKH